MEIFGQNPKEALDRRAEEMKTTQGDIRSALSDLEEKLVELQQLNNEIVGEQKRAHELQKEVIGKMAEILARTEEQEKRSAELTLHTLKRISDLIQMGDEEGGGEAKEAPKKEK